MNKNYNLLNMILSCLKKRGIWPALVLTRLLLHSKLKEWFGKHSKGLIAFGMLAVMIASLYWMWHGFENWMTAKDWMSLWLAIIAFSVSLAGIMIGLAHFLLRKSFRQQVWLRSVYGIFFSVFLGGIIALISKHLPTGIQNYEVIVALAFTGVTIGFKNVFFWFPRAMMVVDQSMLNIDELPVLSDAGRNRVSIHEAGHAICYGLCNGVPEDAFVYVDDDMHDLMAGKVNLPLPRDVNELSRDHVHWALLTTLMGEAAEEVFFGTPSLCSAGDMIQFNQLAPGFLTAGYGELYVFQPETEQDVKLNRQVLERLREKYRILAKQFALMNQDSIEQIAGTLKETGFIDCAGIAAEIKGVVCPEGWELINWSPTIPLYKP